MTLSRSTFSYEGGGVVRSIAVGGITMQGLVYYCVVVTLTDQQWLYYRGWPANTGPNTCYGETLGPINLAVL